MSDLHSTTDEEDARELLVLEVVDDSRAMSIPPHPSELLERAPVVSSTLAEPGNAIQRCLSSRLIVAGLLLICGPIALPALWFSPRFSRTAKWIVSILLFGFTVVFPIAMAWYWLDVAVRPVLEALENSTRPK